MNPSSPLEASFEGPGDDSGSPGAPPAGPPQTGGQLQMTITPEVAGGLYANYFDIRFNPIELRFDFGRVMPDVGAVEVVSRIIMHPAQGKLFLEHLTAALSAYEERFAPATPMMRRPEQLRNIGFRTSEDLRREGVEIPAVPQRKVTLPSDPSKPG
ncbi:MAG: DUF3467 domain-containing protein [bacterium]